MFQDYSLRAVQVIMLARSRAGQRGATAIEVEDLLAALIIEDQGGLMKGLSNRPGHAAHPADPNPPRRFLPPGVAKSLLSQIDALCARSQPIPDASDMHMSEDMKHAFDAASRLRNALQDRKIGPLHLFAGCLEEESSKAAQSLREAGITRESIVKAIKDESVSREKALMEEGAAVAASAPVYSKRTLNIQFLARQRARMRGSSAIEIEDLLVALLIEDQGDFLDALSEFPGVGIDANYLPGPHLPFLPRALANDLLARVEALCSRSEPLPRGTVLPMSETVKRIFAVADLLRGALLQPEIEPLHLLGAALTDGSNSAVQVVREAGITSERIVKALSRSSTNN